VAEEEVAEAAPAHQGVAILLHQEVPIVPPAAPLDPLVLHTVIHQADLTHQLPTCLTTVQLTITIVTLTTV
jgi:hypothetical protein